jgi:hypothetical protein
MKRFNLLTAALLTTCGSLAGADEFARWNDTGRTPSSPPSVLAANHYGTNLYADFPTYPAGFTSYRGLGFTGTCCEQKNDCAQKAWEGYCEAKDCCEPRPTLFDKLRACLHRPCCLPTVCEPTCCEPKGCEPSCCDPCCGFGANWWPIVPGCHEPLRCKLQRLHNHCCGFVHAFGARFHAECCEPCEGKGMPAPGEEPPTKDGEPAAPEHAPAAPEAAPELPTPAPETTTHAHPEAPVSPHDKSASRFELRRLPAF